MATDINTQLQNISSDVTAIGNVVNRLLTIFSGGGVANPDIAVAKAELQGWVQSGYVALTGNQTVAGEKIFTSVTKHNDYIQLYNSNASVIRHYLSGFTSGSVPSSTSRYVDFGWVYDSQDKSMGGVGWAVDVDGFCRVYFRTYALDRHNYSDLSLIYDNSINLWYVNAPTYTGNYLDNSSKVVTTAFLNNSGNSVVHKSGNEEISGNKTFKNRVVVKNSLSANGSYSVVHELENVHRGDISNNITETGFYINSLIWTKDLAPNGNHFKLAQTGYQLTKTANVLEHSYFIDTYNLSSDSNRNTGEFLLGFDDVAQKSFAAFKNTSYVKVSGDILPVNATDNLGSGAAPYDNVYYNSIGAINGSDIRLKDNVRDIPEAVLKAWGKVKFQQFQFKSAIAKKGNNARIHFGVIANELTISVLEAFKSEGLDATKYGILCHDFWEDKYEDVVVREEPDVTEEYEEVIPAIYRTEIDKDGKEIQVVVQEEQRIKKTRIVKEGVREIEHRLVKPAGDQYSVRYEECLILECAYQRYMLNKIMEKVGM